MLATLRPILAACVLAGLAACAPPAAPPVVAAPVSEIEILSPPLRGFFGKRLREGGIPILAHASVSDEAFFAARERLQRVLEHAPLIRRNLEARGHELHLIGLRQFTSDLPEYRDQRGTRLENGDLFDWHMTGGHIVANLSSCTEGTLLPIVGHRYFGDEVCIHELGHAVELLALSGKLRARIEAAYHRSIESGRWKGKYAAKAENEWFAELTKHYFRPEGSALAFYDPRFSQARAWLRTEDPEGFQLVDDLYAGRIDPGVLQTRALVLGPASAEATMRSGGHEARADLAVHNGTAGEIRLVWIDHEGRRYPQLEGSAPPGGTITTISWAGHAYVVTDAAGQGLCTFTVAADYSTADVTGPCP